MVIKPKVLVPNKRRVEPRPMVSSFMPDFRCPGCQSARHFQYRKFDDMLVCEHCNIRVTRVDALSGRPLWVMKDSEAIDVARMTHEHLSYAMAMLITKPDWRPGWLEILTEELERRRKENAAYGDAASSIPSIDAKAGAGDQPVEMVRVTGNKPTDPGTDPGP